MQTEASLVFHAEVTGAFSPFNFARMSSSFMRTGTGQYPGKPSPRISGPFH